MKHLRLIASSAAAACICATTAFADDPGPIRAVPDSGVMFPAILATFIGMAIVAKRLKKR